MSAIWLRRLGLVVAAFVLQTALLKVASPSPEEAPARPSLTGQLLVAAPSMSDPRFERTVILIVQHGLTGAVGIVINKPIGERSLASLFEALGQKGGDVADKVWGIAEADPTLVFDEDSENVWDDAWKHRTQHL